MVLEVGVIMAMVVDYIAIGNRIRKARKIKNVKQDDLAAELGLSVPYMSKIENGRAKINLQRVLDIADALGLSSVDQLLCDSIREHVATQQSDVEEILADLDATERKVLVSQMQENKVHILALRQHYSEQKGSR